MKVCPKCRNPRHPTKEFAWRTKEHKRRQAWCVYCQRDARKKHYHDSPEQYKTRKQEKARRNRESYVAFLLEHPCVDCGEDDPRVLDPDHVRGKKTMNVSKMIKYHAWETILLELAKCEIRCANCHRKKTCTEQNWYKASAA